MKQKIEIFRANCKLCDYTEAEIRKSIYSISNESEIIVYRPEDCVNGSCCEKAEKAGIKAVPSIVIDGKLVVTGKINSNEFTKLLLNKNSRR